VSRPKLNMVELRRAITQLVREMLPESIGELLVRCHGCRRFGRPADAHTARCAVCLEGIFTFCERCGGKARAQRATMAHLAWFSNRIGRKKYGPAHYNRYELYLRVTRRGRARRAA
jgi:hypothetical protein